MLASAASAQEVTTPRKIKLDKLCGASLARFCPELEGSPGQTMSQAICLKPYRTSLPLPCRQAVTKVIK